MGVVRKVEDMKLLAQFKYQDNRTSVWGNVFHVKLDDNGQNLVPQPEEVDSIVFWTKEEIMEKMD